MDFHQAPSFVGEPDLSAYSGQVGDGILVKVTDDFRVSEVKVRLEDAVGTLLEGGDAVMQTDGLTWAYSASTEQATIAGLKFQFKAYDLPGNETVKTITL
ncbi:MAG: hypothetical protein ABIP95_14385 [Pelobium sp.]